MQSALYHGWVRHRRFTPRDHEFRYSLSMLYLDLAEIDDVFAGRWCWSTSRTAPARWHREDHLGDPTRPLDACVRELVSERTGARPDGPVRLLTHPRYLGLGFNPVSFYYCFDTHGENVQAIVAEINNTPWGEQHCYVLPAAISCGRDSRLRFRFGKDFHVSPFMTMDMQYDWRFGTPGNALNVHMENWRDGEQVFDATLTLEHEPITAFSLRNTLLRHPTMSAKVVGAIYWQALLLWCKRIPFVAHPGKAGNDRRNQDGRVGEYRA